MSLLTLPESGYTYITIMSDNGCDLRGENIHRNNGAQWWVDVELDKNRYTIAKWWKFWKTTITFKVFACGGDATPFYQIIELHYK